MVERPTHERVELRDQKSDIPCLKSEQPYNGVDFSALFQAIPLPVFIWQKRGNDFVLIGYNKVSEAFSKGIINSLVGKKASNMYTDLPVILEDFSKCFTEKKSITRELLYKMRTTGEYKYLALWYSYVPPDIILVQTEDLNKRKIAEEELRKSQEFNKQIVESSKDCIKILDLEGHVLFMNLGGQQLMEIEDIMPYQNKSWIDWWEGNNKETARKAISNAIIGNSSHFQGYRPTSKGKPKWWDIIITPIVNTTGNIKGLLVVSRDITNRMHAEKALKELNEQLEKRVEARTSELLITTKQLQNRQEELFRNKLDLEKVNQELMDTNNAISVLARNIDKNREEFEKKIALTINSKIMPIIENLKKQKAIKNKTELDVIVAYLNDISSSLLKGIDIIVSLSSAEMRVTAMIKNGLTSKKIAKKLCISLNTVKTHRRNIRKKLKLHNSNIELATYVRQKWSKE
jgi:PAS domain S-box-containing protein